jgi:signal peptidase I
MECGRQVDLLPDDSCIYGHPCSSVRGIRNERAPLSVEPDVDGSGHEGLFIAPVRKERHSKPLLIISLVGAAVIFVGFAWIGSTVSSVLTFSDSAEVKADAVRSGSASPEVMQPLTSSATQTPSSAGGVQGLGIMLPTIGSADLLGFRNYGPDETPERGHVVSLFAGPRLAGGIRRVVGLAGDEVAIKAGYVWLNGQPVAEKYVALVDPSFNAPATKVPVGSYYVIGDNRSLLTKYPNTYGLVEANCIDCRVATIKKVAP